MSEIYCSECKNPICACKQKELQSKSERIKVLEEALKKIVRVKLNPEHGQIVDSEHYEAAWLDCVEIAREAHKNTEVGK